MDNVQKYKGTIYKITSPQTDKIYVGSTSKLLKNRLCQHYSNYRRFINGGGSRNRNDNNGGYHYVTSFELVKYNDCEIIILEECECNNRKELEMIERKYIETLENVVNHFIPTRGKREYTKSVSVKKCEYDKIRRKEKEIEIKRKKKEAYDKNKLIIIKCECGCEVNKNNLKAHLKTEKHKQNIINITINITINGNETVINNNK